MTSEITPDFHLPTAIYIKQEIVNNIAEIISKYGSRIIIVTTLSDFEIYHNTIEQVANQLKQSDIGCIIYDQLPSIPNTEDIDLAVSFIKKTICNVIIGFGGVESINAAKAIALLTNNYLFCYDLFSKQEINNSPVTLITMPAYPAFGFEIMPLFYLDEIHDSTKKIYYNTNLYPKATIVDPSLSLMITKEKTMETAICALAMSTESVISKQNNDIVNTYALKAIDLIFQNLPTAYKDIHNSTPRVYLSTASVMSGIAFSTAYLSISLAISLVLAAQTKMTVETGISIILPHIMEYNLTASPGKYVQMAKVMGEDVKEITVIEAAIKAVEAIRKLESYADLPERLSQYDVSKSQLKEISKLTMSYPFVENAPKLLNESEIETVLIAAY